MILLWLLCAGVTGQDFCSSPGDLSAPRLFLNTTSALKGDPVLARCADLPNSLVTKVIFCKDGVELSSQKFEPGQVSYTLLLNTSMMSAGRYSCGYQHKDEKNQVANSNHSALLQLKVTDRKAPPDDSPVTSQPEKTPPLEGLRLEIILGIAVGIAVGSCLILAPVTYLLMKKVAPKQHREREQGLSSNTKNMGTDDLIQYAAIGEFGTARIPQVLENETTTYAVIGKGHGRPR
ncbi:uncharacterized protein LOC135976357 [Chrysemys picta bellii]|uniref:uncharacterized protein LOC135976357 n=1 Tax=Chrysemys picta bellii TaxID=8478 RepID=UPI0032B1A044